MRKPDALQKKPSGIECGGIWRRKFITEKLKRKKNMENNYIKQLELYKQSIELCIDNINREIEYSKSNLDRLEALKKNNLDSLCLCNEMIDKEQHGAQQ